MEEINLTDEFDSVQEVVDSIVKNCADAQGVTVEELETVPVTSSHDFSRGLPPRRSG